MPDIKQTPPKSILKNNKLENTDNLIETPLGEWDLSKNDFASKINEPAKSAKSVKSVKFNQNVEVTQFNPASQIGELEKTWSSKLKRRKEYRNSKESTNPSHQKKLTNSRENNNMSFYLK